MTHGGTDVHAGSYRGQSRPCEQRRAYNRLVKNVLTVATAKGGEVGDGEDGRGSADANV